MKFSLKARLLISYGLLALFLVVSLLLLSNYALEYHFQSYVRQKQEQVNQKIVAAVLDEYEIAGTPSMSFLSSLGDEALDNGIILVLYDVSDAEIYCEECTNTDACENMQGMMQQTMRQRYPNWQGNYIEKEYPLIKDDVSYGTVTLGYYGPFFFSEDDLHFISMLNFAFLLIALIFLLIALAVGAFLASHIAKPIKHVIDRTKAIEQNQYSQRIQFISNTKEIDQLISTVNALANTLEIQQQIKKRIASDYAHEFRTPLAALQSNLEGMIDGVLQATPERLEVCHGEILRLSRMAAQIDKLVALENENLLLKKESLDFSMLLKQSAATFEHELHEKKLTLTIEAPTCQIIADSDKISQLIVNLLSNAVKYTDVGGTIQAIVTAYSDKIIFSVSDSGEGIAAQDIPHLFEYLYRTDRSRSRGTGGSGIGLSVAKAIVTAHEGKIEVKSVLGKGSQFMVTLPKK